MVKSVKKKNSTKRLLGLGISASIIVFILSVSTIHFQEVKKSYKYDIQETKKTYLLLSKNAGIIEETKRHRVNFFKKKFFIDFPFKYSYSVSNFIRKLSLITSDYINLKSIQIESNGQNFTFFLIGSIKRDNKINTRSEFLEFRKKLENFDNVVQITSSSLVDSMENRVKSISNNNLLKKLKLREKKVEFIINGEVELE